MATSLREAINECDKDGAWPAALRKTVLPYSLMTKELLNGKGRQKGLLDLEEPFILISLSLMKHIISAIRIRVLIRLRAILLTMQTLL